ncbi:hypothetical protein ES705_34835 [subsurface metagenome]
MKFLLIAIIIAILFLTFLVPCIIMVYAQNRADQIIDGRRPGTEKHINRCIFILTWSNKWVSTNEEPNNVRINRLHVKLDEIRHPHV